MTERTAELVLAIAGTRAVYNRAIYVIFPGGGDSSFVINFGDDGAEAVGSRVRVPPRVQPAIPVNDNAVIVLGSEGPSVFVVGLGIGVG